MQPWRRASAERFFSLFALVVSIVVVGCASTSDRGANPRRSPSTTAATVRWQAPDHGVFVPVAIVPDIGTVSDGALMWAFVAKQCRDYDRTHGTSSSITVDAEPPPSMGHARSDTPCLNGTSNEWAIAH